MNPIDTHNTNLSSRHEDKLVELESLAYSIALQDMIDPAFELAYDRLTKLATKLLKVPVALVSIASADDQFFKSFEGLGQEWAEHRISPRSAHYCRHVVDTGQILEIEDASADPELRDDPVTKQMGVVAYIGIPITLQNGATLGSFCAIDTKPHKWSAEEKSIMLELNEFLVREIELRLALNQAKIARVKAEEANARVVNILDGMLDAGM